MRFRVLYEASFAAPRGGPVRVMGVDPEQVARRAHKQREGLWARAVNELSPPAPEDDHGIVTVHTRTEHSPPPWRAAYPGEETYER